MWGTEGAQSNPASALACSENLRQLISVQSITWLVESPSDLFSNFNCPNCFRVKAFANPPGMTVMRDCHNVARSGTDAVLLF